MGNEQRQLEEQRLRDIDRSHAIRWHQQHTETGNIYVRAAIDFGLEAIRTAALINGGAVIACLAFIGTLQEKSAAASPLLDAVWFSTGVFTVGVVMAGLASGFAYFAQYFYGFEHHAVKLTWEHPYEKDLSSKKWFNRIAISLHTLAALMVLLSYALVIFGAVGVYEARSLARTEHHWPISLFAKSFPAFVK
ncbi:hypothetical protein [Agrobacterium rosae]